MPYTRLAQCIEDMKLYIAVSEIEPGRDGDTLTAHIGRKIQDNYRHARKSFHKECKGYSFYELKLIALHDHIGRIPEIDHFLRLIDHGKDKQQKIRRIICSKPFMDGRLNFLYPILPRSMTCTDDLVDFVKTRGHIMSHELMNICSALAKNRWKKYLREAQSQELIQYCQGGWR